VNDLAANVYLLRPIRVLLVSDDLRFVSLVRFLLAREDIAMESAPRLDGLVAAVEEGVDVVVIDATDALPGVERAVAKLEATHPQASVMVVGDDPGPPTQALAVRPKWLELEQLGREIRRAYLGLDRLDESELARRRRAYRTQSWS
jgi:DNA-binding NtrC family response regulator